MNAIIQLLREGTQSSTNSFDLQTKATLPVHVTEVQNVEAKLGCVFPDLLRNMYIEVSNGHFGEQFRLLSLQDFFVVHARRDRTYLEALGDDERGLAYLVIHDWGCNVYSCIDYTNAPFPVFRYDAIGGMFIPEKGAFEEWVSAWITGENLWDSVMEESQYQTFVNLITATQDISIPFLQVLSEWIDELLISKKEQSGIPPSKDAT